MYLKELHTCFVIGAPLRLLLFIDTPMGIVTWIENQVCAFKIDCSVTFSVGSDIGLEFFEQVFID